MNAQAKFFEKLNQRRIKSPKQSGTTPAATQPTLPGMEDCQVVQGSKRNRRKSGASDGELELIEIHYQRTCAELPAWDRERFMRLTQQNTEEA